MGVRNISREIIEQFWVLLIVAIRNVWNSEMNLLDKLTIMCSGKLRIYFLVVFFSRNATQIFNVLSALS